MTVTAAQAPLSLYRRFVDLLLTKLARASAWVFVGTLAGGVLGYVYQVLMGRMLSPQEYGLFSAMMALFAVLAAPLGTLLMVISRKVSEFRAKQDDGSITHFYYSINIRTAVTGIALLGVCAPFAPQVQSYLGAASIVYAYLLGLLLFLAFLPVINHAFLQGLQSFTWLSASGILGVLLKLIFCVALVWAGYGVIGALVGVALAGFLIWLVTYGVLRRPLAIGRGKAFVSANLSLAAALPVLLANAAFGAMTQLDMVLVNHYFSPQDSGVYAAASVLGKAVMYLPAGIALALFPLVAENHARDEGSAHLLFQAAGLTAILCVGGAIFYFLFGEWIIAVLYGDGYQGAGQVLRYFGFAMVPMALVMVAEYFLIAKGRVLFAYLFVAMVPLQLTAIHFYHDSLQTVVAIIGVSGAILAVVGYGFLWRTFQKSRVRG